MDTNDDLALSNRLFFRAANLLTERTTARVGLVERFCFHACAAAEREIGAREMAPAEVERIAAAIGFSAIGIVLSPEAAPSFGACRDRGTETGSNAVRKVIA